MIRDNIEEAIEVLKRPSVHICDDGCYSPLTCTASHCELKDAVALAVEALHRELQFLDAGYKNEAVEFHIGGRKFSVKELAQ